jgi:hypothetical protein
MAKLLKLWNTVTIGAMPVYQHVRSSAAGLVPLGLKLSQRNRPAMATVMLE